MEIILYGLPVTCTMFGLNHIMRATGYPQKAMLSAVLTVGMNIILAPIFIFWLKWGIRGAAIATVLSQCVGMVWVLSHFRNPKSTVHFRQGTFRLRWKIVSKHLFHRHVAVFAECVRLSGNGAHQHRP